MKRRFIPGLVLAAAFTLTNCSEQLVSPEKENDIIVDETVQTPNEEGERIPYVIYADIPVTKTIANSNGTYWAVGDQVTVYTKGESFVCQGPYIYAEDKTFDGEITTGTLADVNDWYCIYPYKSSATGTVEKIQETITIGAAASNYVQTQNAVNSMTHIAGVNVPMYGIKKQVPEETTPEFSMSHLSALVAVKVVNSTNNPITIEQVGLEAATNKIVGDFTLGFDGETPTLVSVDATSSNKAVLNLANGGDAIQPNSIGMFYLAVAPVKDRFKIYLNGAYVTNNQEIPLEAGKMTTLKVTIPELQGTVSSNYQKTSSDFITWPNEGISGSVNGAKATIYTVNKDGNLTMTAKLGDFIGPTQERSVLPLSFYAATPDEGDDLQLTIETVALYVGGIKVKEFEYSTLQTKLGFDFKLPLRFAPCSPNSWRNIIVFNEAMHYYLDEAKAQPFIKAAGVDLSFDDLRKAFYKGNGNNWETQNQIAWDKFIKALLKFAPGQFNVEEVDGILVDKTSKVPIFDEDGDFAYTEDGKLILKGDDLGNTILGIYSQPAVERVNDVLELLNYAVALKLKSNANAVFWGLNIQSRDKDVQ